MGAGKDSRTNGPAPLRRDAQRNKDLLIAAAREIYAEQGVDAPLDEIARRAGVGNATLYRRFPTRAALIEEVFHDALTATLRAGEEARKGDDAWAAFTGYLERIFEGLATDRGANDLMTTGIEGITSLDALRSHHHETISILIRRAQDQGTMRDDVVTEDLLFALAALGRVVPAAATVVPDSWRRHLALLLDGLRTEAARPLPVPPFTLDQFGDVLQELGTPRPGRQ
ncbi:helix-turn-helix domain-containing protein [Streptomyces sp. NPDC004647]|uniref:TetR/AcrR family transcriptional regulator n=1 Tax=Streptomyces sp. NPDC004647 TaxID=3154671 RepID=UPI0033A37A16